MLLGLRARISASEMVAQLLSSMPPCPLPAFPTFPLLTGIIMGSELSSYEVTTKYPVLHLVPGFMMRLPESRRMTLSVALTLPPTCLGSNPALPLPCWITLDRSDNLSVTQGLNL